MLFALMLFAADDDRAFGAPLPPGARKLEQEGRYAAGRSYDDTLEFYEKLYKNATGFRFKPIISAPTVKAVHLQNVKGNGWTGMNIYEVNGAVRIFVLKADDPPSAKKPPTKKK